jgi:hypothetical protein
MNNRPPGLASAPKGFEIDEESNSYEGKPIFKNGIVSYDRKLTEEELKKFEMTPVGGSQVSDVADYIIEKMGSYAKQYGEEKNKEHLNNFVEQELRSVPYSKRVPGFEYDNLKKIILDKLKS